MLPPPPSLNGGLYTGEPFMKDAPWRNFPATPDAGYLTNVNLLAGGNRPPWQALYHIPGGGVRPGNNTPYFPADMAGGCKRLPTLNIVGVPNRPSPSIHQAYLSVPTDVHATPQRSIVGAFASF